MNRCEEHKLELESYCQVHGSLCCRECITSKHGTCENIIPLGEAVAGSNVTDEVKETVKVLETLVAKFESTRNGERDSLRSVDTQGKELEKKVKKFRQSVDKMLDKLELSMIMKKDELAGDEVKVIKQRLGVCETAIENLKDGLQKMKAIQRGKNEQKSFIAVNTVKVLKNRYEDILDEIVDGKGTFSLNFIPNKDLVQALDSLGSINVKSTIRPAEISKDDKLEPKLAKIAELNVRAPCDTSACTISGCVPFCEDRLILADETNKSVKVVGPDKTVVSWIKLDYSPWDIVALSEPDIAVRCSFSETVEENNNIYILSVAKEITENRSIAVDGRPRAIAYDSPKLVVAVSKDDRISIFILHEKDGSVLKTIKPRKNILKEPQYISLDPERKMIFISDFYKGITALSFEGVVIFDRVNGNTTEYGGITVDDSGDVFVCAGKPYGIYKVAVDGSGMTPFVTWETEDIDPQALTFCENNRTFVVTSCNSDKAFVYAYV
ncbi:uncharacterized protein LOC128552107 [Mercenaria mercenaria]|uniref:uncharacterized protein LOC128552107 n=1 Tax=Mercenaria mercenaria TaxID=6596 RepID=UPI00234F367E|nr:uncharacterized protein LOC128552107 [Mercenaria mercenaria]